MYSHEHEHAHFICHCDGVYFRIHERLHCQRGVSTSFLSKHMWLNIWAASWRLYVSSHDVVFFCSRHSRPTSIRLMFAYAPNMKHTSQNLCQNWQLLACISDRRRWNELCHFKRSHAHTHTRKAAQNARIATAGTNKNSHFRPNWIVISPHCAFKQTQPPHINSAKRARNEEQNRWLKPQSNREKNQQQHWDFRHVSGK